MFDYYAPTCRTVESRRDNLRTSRCRMLLFGQADHHIGIKFAIDHLQLPDSAANRSAGSGSIYRALPRCTCSAMETIEAAYKKSIRWPKRQTEKKPPGITRPLSHLSLYFVTESGRCPGHHLLTNPLSGRPVGPPHFTVVGQFVASITN